MNDGLLYVLAISALLISDGLLVVLGVLMHRSRRRRSEGDAPAHTAAHEALRRDLQALIASMDVLGERLARLETRISRIQERGEQPPLPNAKESDRKAFEVASKLALRGADVEELISLCGLTRGEAELIRMLHAGSQAPAS